MFMENVPEIAEIRADVGVVTFEGMTEKAAE